MTIAISDRELVSVLGFLRACPPGEEEMAVGLRMFDVFDFGDVKWAVSDDGNVDLARLSSEPTPRDLTADDLKMLRSILSRPGQPPPMWLSSARCLRRIRENEPKALTSAP